MKLRVFLHELVRNTRQARFWIWCVTTVSLLSVSAVNFADDLQLCRQENAAIRTRFKETLDSLESPAELRQIGLELNKGVDVPSWLTYGTERRIPSTVYLNLVDGKVHTEHLRVRNLLAGRVLRLDWVFVATFCLALAATLQGADLIAGEAAEGTLRLVLANPLTKAAWLVGKIAGTLAALGLPALLAGAFSLVIFEIKGVGLDGPSLILMAVAFAETGLLLLVFLLAAAWISTVSASRSMALIGSLLVWLSLVFVLPGLARGVAELLEPTASPEEIEDELLTLRANASIETQADLDAFVQQRSLAKARFFQRLERQIMLARWLEIASPLAAFEGSIGALADSGWPRHRRFLIDVENQMRLLWEVAGERTRWQAYPDFKEGRLTTGQRLWASLGGCCVLICQSGLLFAGALASLSKLEIQ